VTRRVRIPVIASGGAGTLEHLREALDDSPGCGAAAAVLAASIFHFGVYRIPEAKAYLDSKGVLVRPLRTP
jgi:imidazole glycerol-phosphate synthase subunit HisF